MTTFYNLLFSISVFMSVTRFLVLFWITFRCGRFLCGQWFRWCCGQSTRTSIFVIFCTVYGFSWTLHSAYLCLDVGLSLSDHWTDASRIFCVTQATIAIFMVAINVGLSIAQILDNILTNYCNIERKWTRNLSFLTVVLMTPLAKYIFGTSPRFDESGYVYMDVSNAAEEYVGPNVTADLHLLLCDKNNSGHTRFPLTSTPVLTELGVVLVLVVVASIGKAIVHELSTETNTPMTFPSYGSRKLLHAHSPCTFVPHPVNHVSNTMPSVIFFWVILLRPVVYAILTISPVDPWLNVGAGTHLLLVLSIISVALTSTVRGPVTPLDTLLKGKA